MPKLIDPFALDAGLSEKERVVTHHDLRLLGLSNSSIARRIGPAGPWQRLFPGVVLAHRGSPTRREWLLGALAFAGGEAVVTGTDAVRAAGVRQVPLTGMHLLVPHHRQRKSYGSLRIERTVRMPTPILRDGIPYTPAPRAAIDAARQIPELRGVRDVIASVVQQRVCDVESIRRELRRAARQRTALANRVLAEVAAGIRSVAEAQARDVFVRCGVPMPLWNVRLVGPDGRPFLTPDAWWPEFGVAMEIDSLAWHFRPDDWRQTQRRQRLMALHRVMLLSYAPQDIIDAPESFAREVLAFLHGAAGRPLPDVTAIA